MSTTQPSRIRILLLGDIIGSTGRALFKKHINRIKKECAIDGVIVNGENSFKGKGITPKVAAFFKEHGVDVITTGNHIWQQREIQEYLTQHTDVLRPANFPASCPGVGLTTFMCKSTVVGVLNMQGRTFMRELTDCPFRTADSALSFLKSKTNCILVDFHAEATSEKTALANYLDGRVSAVVGTHTHVPTSDERILPKGTGYVTDLGMAGSQDSIIGVCKEPVIKNFLTQMPQKFTVEKKGPYVMSGVWVELDTATGKTVRIERVHITDSDELQVEEDL